MQRQLQKCLSFSERGMGGRNHFSSSGPITSKLNELVTKGDKHPDKHQLQAAAELDRLYEDLLTNDPQTRKLRKQESSPSTCADPSTIFGNFFGSDSPVLNLIPSLTINVAGAYLYGGVGCGKTFLMNLLYHSIDSGAWADDKQKVHYHKFMLNVHQHMHKERQVNPHGDLIAPVVDRILEKGRLLCLDEFQVTDVADALILQQLFQGLWKNGCVLVVTSNRPPRDLYLNGLQRDLFIPFIDRLERKCAIVNMLDSETDYRMMNPFAQGAHPVYFSKGKFQDFQSLFDKLTDGIPVTSTSLRTQGRKVAVPMASISKSVAQFSFEDLCEKALGAADYLVIAQNFETVFCHSIPKLSIYHVNWLRRFITFIDTMYELKVTLILHTDASSIDDIFVVDNKDDYSQDEVFAFDRSRSRLEEMAGKKYLSKKWQGENSMNERRANSMITYLTSRQRE
jgi:protein AFG1